MDFDFKDQEQAFIGRVKDAVEGLLREQTAAGGSFDETVDVGEAESNLRKALETLAKVSYLDPGLTDASEQTGSVVMMAAMETVAAHSPSLHLGIESSTRLFGRLVARFGDPSHRRACLTPLLEGSIVGAVALSEHAMNVDNDPLETVGLPSNGGFTLTGTKNYVVNGPVADWYAIVGLVDEQPTAFLVKRGAKGLEVRERVATLGFEGTAISSLDLDACHVPAGQVLTLPRGKKLLGTLRMWENQVLLSSAVGMMQATLDTAKPYALMHQTGGKPLIAYQEIAFKLAEMLTQLQTSRYMAYRATWAADAAPKEAESLTWAAKVFCGEAAEKVASAGLQILSGAGYMTHNPAERAYRNARYLQIAGTSNEIARMRLGDETLGKPL